MKNEVPLKEQVRIVVALCFAILAFILVLSGSDFYINRYNFPQWLEIVFNILSLLFAIGVAGAFFASYASKKER